MYLKIASLLVISVFFVSCSSKTKKADAPAEPAKQEAAKKTESKAPKAEAPAKAAATATEGSVVCKNGSDTRTIEVIGKDGGCEVSYTKFDQTSTPATAVRGTEHCANVQAKIKDNLEAAGFKCE